MHKQNAEGQSKKKDTQKVSNLETLDRLRSSTSLLNPGEGEANAGLHNGSVIPKFALTASDGAVTSGLSDSESKKKCFSIALRHILVVLEMH